MAEISFAAEVDKMTFLIPSATGGGWDMTARETANVLVQNKMIDKAYFVNIQGAGGVRGLAAFINDSETFENAVMVQSTPLIFRSLNGVYEHGFRDLTPLCSLIAEYQVIAVRYDSSFKSLSELIDAIKKDPARHSIWGGSPVGSLDYVVAAMILKAGGVGVTKFRYGTNKVGGKSVEGLLTGRASALVTGYGEILEDAKAGRVRILGITSAERLPDSTVPTLREQGLDVVFMNWRGFFARPGVSEKQSGAYQNLFRRLSKTPEWADMREKYGWNDFFKTGKEFVDFLEDQERELSIVLKDLDLMKKD